MANSDIQVVLLDAGHIQELNSTDYSVQLTYVSSSVRPDCVSVALPELGDVYNPSGITVSGQSIIDNSNNSNLICKTVNETYFADDHTIGTQYQVYYDTASNRIEITDDDDVVVMSINSGAQVDNYTYDPSVTNSTKLYVEDGGVWKEIESVQSIPKITVNTNVSTTSRERLSATNVIALGNLAGYVNSSTMWGIGAGNILYNGIQAQPVAEIENAVQTISWNVTHSYTIRYIPGISTNAWQYVFYKGAYTRLATDPAGSNKITFYPSTTLPDEL